MNSKPQQRRTLGLEGIKLVIGTSAMAATIALWSVFANRDLLGELTAQSSSVETAPASEIMSDLPPIPTLVPFMQDESPQPTSQPLALTTEGLRSVSAPVLQNVNPSAPRVVQGNNGGSSGSGGDGTVTTTRSS